MKFKQGINPNQEFLFPKKLSDFLSDNHLAKAVYEIVDTLNLSRIAAKYSNIGQNAYDPHMMVRLLFYGYCKGVRSSRKISKGCEDRFDFVYLANNLKPSHDRISDFRKDNMEELKAVFKDIVLIGVNLGLTKFGNINVSIDGSKIRANASAKLSKDEKGFAKLLEKTEQEMNELLQEARKVDEEEDEKYGRSRGDELPKTLRSKKSRLDAIKKAYELLKEQKEHVKNTIRKEKDREPTDGELKKIDRMKINVTDNDAKFMKQRNGVIKPNYNVQISVDEKNQFILANDVTDECNDQHQLVPMVKQTKKNFGKSPNKVKADNGYHSQLEKATELFPETEFFIDDKNRRKEDLDLKKIKKNYNAIKFKNLKKLLSKRGSEEYKKRMHTAEPPFGDMKHNSGYRSFLLRGLQKVKGEFNLMCIAYNLKKIVRFVTKNGTSLAVALKNLSKRTNIGNVNGNSMLYES